MSSSASPQHPSPSPAWGPPKFPLPPHKLAKLANALGIPTPIPAQGPSNSPTNLSPSNPDPFRRSPTPSPAFQHNLGYSQSVSRFLLHVIPPGRLLHDLEQSDNSPSIIPNSPGYHVQFRRGVLVPMHSTLQSQLAAIAKEYSLPSSAGLILYLVQSVSSPTRPTENDESDTNPGPRLSEDIWRLLWTRAIQVEREENARTLVPNAATLGLRFEARSLQELSERDGDSPIVPPLETSQSSAQPLSSPSSSSAPSSAFDRSQCKSAPPSSSSIAQSEPETPDTSAALHTSQDCQFELPGLRSSSFVPILAKVEFDIDQRNATWYDPWLRSKRVNLAKRAESRLGKRKDTAEEGDGGERRAPLDLMLVNRMQSSSPSSSFVASISGSRPRPTAEGYGLLTESPLGMDSDDSDSDNDDCDLTTRITNTSMEDPLEDVFGTDADAWSEIRDAQHHGLKDPHVVDLPLHAAELSETGGDSFEHDFSADLLGQKEEDEVRELLDAMSRPRLSVTVTSSPPIRDEGKLASTTSLSIKKHVPPPLVLPPRLEVAVIDDQHSPLPTSSASANAPHLLGDYDDFRGNDTLFSVSSDGAENEFSRFRRPFDDKRDGGVFDGLDLGLEGFEDFDDNDPNDRRKSLFVMSAKLDEIEKNLAQFSPQRLKTDASVENLVKQASSSPPPTLSYRNMDSLSPHAIPASSDSTSRHHEATMTFQPISAPVWPSVPFSSLMAEIPKSRSASGSPSPRLAINGISTDIPTFWPQPSSSSASHSDVDRNMAGVVQSESEMRKRELAEQELLYSALSPSKSPIASSPVFPVSPDPFRRHPSPVVIEHPPPAIQEQTTSDAPAQRRRSKERHETERRSHTTSSRFSTDSITVDGEPSVPKSRPTLINVKSFKNLWRKSNKSSISGNVTSAQVPVPSPPPLLAAPVLSEHTTSERLPPAMTLPLQSQRADSALDRFHFDQDSRYPVRRPTTAARPTTPNVAPAVPEKDEKERGARKSILKSWKSSSVSMPQNADQPPEHRSSVERLLSKARRPSLLNLVPGGPSPSSADIPPSPHIPQQFVHPRSNATSDRRLSAKSKQTESSVDPIYPRSPPTPPRGAPASRSHSVASSRASDDTRHSFDTSQFEMVSPKVNPSLTYPYHGLDPPR